MSSECPSSVVFAGMPTNIECKRCTMCVILFNDYIKNRFWKSLWLSFRRITSFCVSKQNCIINKLSVTSR